MSEDDRTTLRHHVAAVERKYAIRIVGSLPRGSVAHVIAGDGLDLLGEKGPALTPFALAEAEYELSERLGRPVGIVLATGLRGREAEELPRLAAAL